MEAKQWGSAALLLVLVGVFPWALLLLGVIDGVRLASWVAIALLFLVLVLKVAYAPVVSGQFTYAKQGNDLCLVTLSGVLGIFSLQAATTDNLLPGAGRLLAELRLLQDQPGQVQNIVGLTIVGGMSLLLFILTAHQNAGIRKTPASRWAPVRAVGCYFLGLLCASAYVLILAVK